MGKTKMGGTTLLSHGDNQIEALEDMVRQLKDAEEYGLYLDSPINILEQITDCEGKLVIVGNQGNDMGICMFNTFMLKNYKKVKWEKCCLGITHAHA